VPPSFYSVAGIVKNLVFGSDLPGTQVSDDLCQRVLAASTRSLFAPNCQKSTNVGFSAEYACRWLGNLILYKKGALPKHETHQAY